MLRNKGKEPAHAPQVELHFAGTSKANELLTIFPLTKEVDFLDSISDPTLSAEPTDRALTITFLKKGLANKENLRGEDTACKILVGFALEDTDKFVIATDQALDLMEARLNNSIKVRAFVSADNSRRKTLLQSATLNLGFSWDEIQLVVDRAS